MRFVAIPSHPSRFLRVIRAHYAYPFLLTRFVLISVSRDWSLNFSGICYAILKNSIDLERLISHEFHIKISGWYLVYFRSSDHKRNPHFFEIADSYASFPSSKRGKRMRAALRKLGELHISFLLGTKPEVFILINLVYNNDNNINYKVMNARRLQRCKGKSRFERIIFSHFQSWNINFSCVHDPIWTNSIDSEGCIIQ